MFNIENDRQISFFRKLVETDSPTGDERKICDILKQELTKLGISFFEDGAGEKFGGTSGNLYAFIEGDKALSPILFSAHMDTVAPALNKKFILDDDGRIHTDGTTVLGSDDFAGISAIIEAVNRIKENNISHRPIELLFAVSEEVHCLGTRNFDYGRIKSKTAYVFDMEGVMGSACYAAPTIMTFKADFIGKSAHAGFAPELGIHAVKAASKAVSAIYCGKTEDECTVNIGSINGGKATNIVPDLCSVTGEIRSYNDERVTERIKETENIMQSAADEFGAKLKFTAERGTTAYSTDLNSDVVKRFEKGCKSLDLTPVFIRSFGGSDNNIFAEHGIDGLVVSTGMNGCHTTAEWTTVDELKQASALCYALMTVE